MFVEGDDRYGTAHCSFFLSPIMHEQELKLDGERWREMQRERKDGSKSSIYLVISLHNDVLCTSVVLIARRRPNPVQT